MSKENVKQMFGKMEKDVQLQKKYAEMMQTLQKENEKNLADKLVELGQTVGLVFSKDDLIAARAELIDNVNANKELSDKDLEKVAGGGITKVGTVFFSITSVGIGCAALSIASSTRSYGCAGQLSIDGTC
ncbi:MAG: hypothetical protein A2008_05785 [Candidatus Wallbacteria bacterium GWC2_49_35]|uniref:Nif11 domain-containing protein n=1 Tax=Candidatus Wallbacteria bacterium GWC2_49_35 TaxID=1817813 RepID=A0A1F7WL08_9BACT|nr:MAG: hypothetical protein A2008_05785 [Candidatus Wallbacteria bacterium GWC2_49_35]HBC75546.1 hypothetical protein [Candidatus Wallbacteria bacterium]